MGLEKVWGGSLTCAAARAARGTIRRVEGFILAL